jgi:TolA-binding protein
VQYLKKDYKTSQKTCFDLINNMPNYDYWFAKTFILLADNYIALKDNVQAIATLKSVIDNYEGKDEILDIAKEKLKKLDTK